MRRLILNGLLIASAIITLFLLFYSGVFGTHIFLRKSSFAQLPNWQQDDQTLALQAFQQSCARILTLDPNSKVNLLPHSGTARDWQAICSAAKTLTHPNAQMARQFFENWFQPYRVENNFNPNGLFTGYYLPLVHASLVRDKQYNVPLYASPPDLVKINLSTFRPELAGKTLVGKLKNNLLYPYPDRAAIMRGDIDKNTPVIAWSNNVLDVFFAQIQGSAVVQLPDQSQFVIGYASENGQPYTPIGKILIAKNALTKKTVSMQSIRAWLEQHPEQMDAILNHNASYIFFRTLKDTAPIGFEGVPLTAQRSLAVDTKFIPMGAPVWLSASIPDKTSDKNIPLHRLLVAQDKGGAIKGVVRGDVYWGAGEEAAFIAGNMKSPGKYWVLLPKV